MTTRTVSVKLTADVTDLRSQLRQGGAAVRQLAGELDKAAKGGHVEKITQATAVMGAGLLGAAGAAVKMRMDFDKSMSAAAAATNANAKQFHQLSDAAIQAGKDTQFSATQAADGITELGKAGISTSNILHGGLKGALDLAAAGQISVADAASIAASALTQFKLSGSAVPHLADLLAAGANKAQGGVGDLGMALNQSGIVAHQFNLSVEDTVGALSEFANAGLIGSDAGTSFKTMLQALANPSDITKNEMRELGISFYDAQGKFIGLAGVAQVLQTRLKGLTDQQRQQALSQIFGSDAVRAASVLYTDGAKGVEKWRAAVNVSGYAASNAAELTNNLAGDIERLKGSLETLAIESGGGVTAGLRSMTKGANEAVNAFADLPHWLQQSVTMLSGISGASLLAAAGFLKARSTSKEFLKELSDMGPRGTSAANFLGKVGGYAGKVTLVGTALFGAYAGMKAIGDWVDHFSAPTARSVDKMTDSLQQFAATGKVSGELAKTFGADMSGLSRDLAAIQKSQSDLASIDALSSGPAGQMGADRARAALGSQIKQMRAQADADIAALDQSLANLASNGNLTAARIAFQDFAQAQGITLGQLPKYADAAKNAAVANTGLAQGFGDAAANSKTLTSSLEDAVSAGQKLTDVWNQLHGAVLSSDQANLAAKQSIDDVKKSFKDNAKALKESKGGLDGNSEAALKNRIAVELAAQAAAKAAQAKYEETGSIKDANKTYDGYIDQLRKTLGQSKLTKGQVDKLIHSYTTMPPSVTTNVKLTGAKGVADKLNGLSKIQQALAKGTKIPINPTTFFHGLAEGGWTGPGSKYQPAGIVHADEFVIRADSRRKIERSRPGMLDAINQTGEVPPGYASGGQVWPFPVNVKNTKIPKPMLTAPGGGSGPGYKWMEAAVHAAFPGMAVYSDYRPGAITITGNKSYHGFGRAVDFAPSKPLAEWINLHYMAQTKELITPWQSLNIQKGHRHKYSALIENEHNFAGGNAHDHWAMANGGIIPEHVIGVGRSGRTYEFGEAGPEAVTPLRGYAGGGLVNVAPRTASSSRGSKLDTADAILAARSAVDQLTASLKENGRTFSMATQKGRDNRSSLISGIKAAQDAAKAKYDETGSVKAANKVYDDYIRQLDASLKKMKVNTATRRALIKAYSERPAYDLSNTALSNSSARVKSVQDFASAEDALANAKTAFAWTKPTFSGRTEQGRAELQTLFSYLSAAEAAAQSQYQETGNAKTATAFYNGYISQLRTILLKAGITKAQVNSLLNQYARITLTRNRWGGLYTHAADGALTDAQIAPAGPTRYAWAEASTGGELFAPKNGNLAKTRAQVGWAVSNWWGGQVTWQPGARTATPPTAKPQEVHLYVHDGKIEGLVRAEVDNSIGSVVSAVIYQSV